MPKTVQHIDPISGADKLASLEDERQFERTEVERKVTLPDSNRKILQVQELKKYADISIGKSFAPEQQQWLDRSRASLVENLSIDRDEFDVLPRLERAGGSGEANKKLAGSSKNSFTRSIRPSPHSCCYTRRALASV